MSAAEYEKLGVFYLGKAYDAQARARLDAPVLYDARNLVTHAVCVGMTGSGKTGLCVGLLEEAAIDGIPAIVIDPKGDLANLALTFPNLSAEEFRPWIDEDEARRQSLEPEAFAAKQAELWRTGLEKWGQDAGRVRRLREASEVRVYTPASNAGRGVSILRSFAAPPEAIRDDRELLRERISTAVTGLLGLAGVQSEPMQSREHILLSTILHAAWSVGEDLDLPTLIGKVQEPGFTRLGVMELETVFPGKDRFALAMTLNNLVASPGFSAWAEGEALDLSAMLYGPGGKPRTLVFSISHLNDAERMFFVSLLLSEVLGWTRSQSGTSSLRALVYMDEIAGYVPPVANPPSKAPLLTLMKQARAFGVGVVLATQNPVDLDYKGLSNAGTWFLGRLQTDRDKQRVLDGLEGASASSGRGFDRAEMDRLLSSLGARVFVMNNVHEAGPRVFETRWCLSYLRGPMTRAQLRALTKAATAAPEKSASEAPKALRGGPEPRAEAQTGRSAASGNARPVLPPEIPQYFLAARGAGPIEYRPMVLGLAKVYYSDKKSGVEAELSVARMPMLTGGPVAVDFEHTVPTQLGEGDLLREMPAEGTFAALPSEGGKARSYDTWKRVFADAIYRTEKLELRQQAELGLVSRLGEKAEAFEQRVAQALREKRDALIDELREEYAPRLTALQERLRKAQQNLAVQKEQASAASATSALSFGAALLGAFMGRRTSGAATLGRAASATRSAGRASRERADVARANETVEMVREKIEGLDHEFQAEASAIAEECRAMAARIEPLVIKPKKAGISVRACVLVWAPFGAAGEPAWE
jgi:hypothetical protein